MPPPEQEPTRNQRKQQVRREAALAQQRQLAADKRRRVLTVSAGVVLAVLVVIGAAIALSRSGGDGSGSDAVDAAPVSSAVPKGLTGGAILSGQADAPVTLTLIEDLQCPACQAFEQATGSTISELRDAGTIKVEERPVAFLDRASTTAYSTRSLNALGCVVDSTPSAAVPFVAALFAQQPAEGSAGLTDAQLGQVARTAGAADVQPCIDGLTFKGWTQQLTQAAVDAGVDSTPTVLVDGTVLADRSPDGLRKAVAAAAAT